MGDSLECDRRLQVADSTEYAASSSLPALGQGLLAKAGSPRRGDRERTCSLCATANNSRYLGGQFVSAHHPERLNRILAEPDLTRTSAAVPGRSRIESSRLWAPIWDPLEE